jgi:acyl-CoA synthetase (NDP forming)
MIITEKEAEDFLEHNKFPVVRRLYCTSLKECEKAVKKITYPVVMKVASSKILHKSDVGGVVVNITSPSALKNAFAKMKKIKGFEGVMVQQHLSGEYLLLGLKKDPTFGHTIAVGAGGIYTEVLNDVSFRICPLTNHDAQDMLEELQLYPILKGVRGGKDMRKKVKALVLQLSSLASQFPMITELDINPLILHEKGVSIVDARLVIDSHFS